MADSQQKIDWNALGKAAQQCVGSAWRLAHWGDRSQEDGYNVDDAAVHLAEIDRATDILRQAIALFERRHFKKIALASVGEGPRPDFRFGEACYSTAHEAALELLRAGVLHIEDGLIDIAEDRGTPDNYFAGIDDLHVLSPDDLRDTLIDVYARPVSEWAVKEIEFARVKEFQAWIDREWAAASSAPAKDNQDGLFSTADSPTRWAKQFKISPKTFKRRVRDGKIRAKSLSDRLYQVHLDDLPKQEKANESGHK
jgi:hypothetical protein